ncbi:TNT domain-containing protein [Streptomyces sp. ICBB 8177]|uniref:TNT domain-containing protein n=1 Tax=Streptomyces sp. ICBB 8177 TaxID=563922 RepID=UPI000D681DA2|nr:TNT domain-containing protein [Streptomyces sp. ICBB 8177]PWI42220.1 hypothetical protein CK485_26070 [Streptomyces sp. ICBB 8177]
MRVRRFVAALFASAFLVPVAVAAPATAASPPAHTHAATCSAGYFDQDARLGPARLPDRGRVGHQLIGYRRTGGLGDRAFLARYYDAAANSGQGGWIYPPANGYVTRPDGTPVEWHQALRPGQDIDRYGSEYGSFLAPEGLPYAERSIPPQSLDGTPAAGCNYHDYRVLKAFSVDAGPIAPWFGQPGRGRQYQLDASLLRGAPTQLTVGWLVANGYLRRLV